MTQQYNLILVTLALAIVRCLGASTSIDEDLTCLIQVQHRAIVNSSTLPLGADADLESPSYNIMQYISAALDKASLRWPPLWDFDNSDAGGLDFNEAHTHHKLHPLWRPEWYRCIEGHSLEAGVGIFLAGILCCAGGIGGGGIYVTVLMVLGSLSVWDAVPLSKVIVFAASTPSLILNAMKGIKEDDTSKGKEKPLIDWNLLRIVVPFALIGTLMGVFLNNILPGKLIVGILSFILLMLTAMISRTGYRQHCEEVSQAQVAAGGAPFSNTEDPSSPVNPNVETNSSSQANDRAATADSIAQGDQMCLEVDPLQTWEIKLACSMLALIVYCGVIHYYAEKCAHDVTDSGACRQPFALIFTFGLMPRLKSTGFIHYLGVNAMIFAISYCTLLGAIVIYRIVSKRQVYGSLHKFHSIGNSYTSLIIAFYVVMSAVTGCLAGLVGIGGGLIFSPVFIQMNIDPHIAVASSATCVIFTSSSTSFQYLFTDRIIVALVFSFCTPHLLAAYTGTKIVHYIQDYYATRKSWITWIVALGVGISCVLAIQKLFSHRKVAD